MKANGENVIPIRRVCWNKIRSRQEIARALIEADNDESR